MRITEKQLLLLIDVLKDSLPMENYFTIKRGDRIRLYSAIIDQQSNQIKDVSDDNQQ